MTAFIVAPERNRSSNRSTVRPLTLAASMLCTPASSFCRSPKSTTFFSSGICLVRLTASGTNSSPRTSASYFPTRKTGASFRRRDAGTGTMSWAPHFQDFTKAAAVAASLATSAESWEYFNL